MAVSKQIRYHKPLISEEKNKLSGPQPGIPLILASTSAYRRLLLQRLGIAFTALAPSTDETPRRHENGAVLALRLANDKAQNVAAGAPGAVVIGADQVAVRGDTLLGKPGDADSTRRQLMACSGQELQFHTAVAVLDGRRGTVEQHIDQTRVAFRTLTPQEIDRYVEAEQPYDCAGGFKAEGLGIALFSRIENEDPSALMGLPLIWLASALRRCGYRVP